MTELIFINNWLLQAKIFITTFLKIKQNPKHIYINCVSEFSLNHHEDFMILSVKLITFRISENKIYSMISIKTRWYCIGVFGNDIIFMVQVIFMLIHKALSILIFLLTYKKSKRLFSLREIIYIQQDDLTFSKF